MYKIRTRKAGIIGFFSVAAALILVGAFANFARADISNPHPTPPANSVTNTMIQTGTILDSAVSSSSQIQLSKSKYVGIQGDVLIGSSSEATSTHQLNFDMNSASLFVGSTTPSQSATSSNSLYVQATTTTQNLNVSATTTWGGVRYGPPAAQSTSGQVLQNDGNGNLSWATIGKAVYAIAVARPTTSSASMTRLNFATIAAGSLGVDDSLHIRATFYHAGNSNTIGCQISIGDGTATTTRVGPTGTFSCDETVDWFFMHATNSSYAFGLGSGTGGTSGSGTAVLTYNSTGKLFVSADCLTNDNTDPCTLAGFQVTKITP